MACREAPEHVRRAEGGSMRGGQGEIYRGDCADSRAVMPYNSDATRTKISDSSVGRHPAFRPHQKSLRPAMHTEIQFAFVKKMDRFFGNSHAHSSPCMQGGRTWFQARKTQQPTPRVYDALKMKSKNVRPGIAGRAREGGARPAALVGRRHAKPRRRVRGRTVEPVWSTGSEKGDGRAFGARIGRLSRAPLLSRFRTTGLK